MGGGFIKRFDSVAPLKPRPSVGLPPSPCRPAARLTPRRSDREEAMQLGQVGQRLRRRRSPGVASKLPVPHPATVSMHQLKH